MSVHLRPVMNWYSEDDMRRWDYGCYPKDMFAVEERNGVLGRLVYEHACVVCNAVVFSPLGGITHPDAPPHRCAT